MVEAAAPVADDGKIVCHIDNSRVHSVELHIRKNHPDWTVERYQQEFPGQPLLSKVAEERFRQLREESAAKPATIVSSTAPVTARLKQAFMHEVFGLGAVPAALSAVGQPITINVLEGHDEHAAPYLKDVDHAYVFNIDLLKKVIIAMELNMPLYLWGYHGTGKTTVLQQVAARTRRPFVRVQHTANTEESHIVGQYVVKTSYVEEEAIVDGARTTIKKPVPTTEFQLGPLPMAMLYGWVYCADEYDFAMPSVTSVYQSVLEGEPLIIKEAPKEFRVINPHPNFRFVATGNTNGIGDETGLYQGTMIQNAANYSRFKIVEEVRYMDPKIEEAILVSKTGIDRQLANKLVKFGKQVRESFADSKISMTVSPRELITAATMGLALSGNFLEAINLCFANRLSRIDKKTVGEFAQRIFGN